ncbi:MAG: HAMP domain-containing histidine kinase [Bacteroidales bacterium]|jgi:signal transduction histidine kinase|nr:HAMP domain-containing histidine kinase [Bacteroidales bacterium]
MGKAYLRVIYLFIVIAFAMLVATHWFAQVTVSKTKAEEVQRVRNWASSLQQQAYLVNYTQSFFYQLQEEERKSAVLWEYAYEKMMSPISISDFNFFIKIFSTNRTIPFVVTDKNYRIVDSHDPEVSMTLYPVLKDSALALYSENPPISFKRNGEQYLFFYRRSALFIELQRTMDALSNSFNTSILENVVSIPVIITDSTRRHVVNCGNIDRKKLESDSLYLQETLSQMKNEPIIFEGFDISDAFSQSSQENTYYIFYKSSSLIGTLQLFPYILSFSLLFVLFGIILVFRYSQKREQDRVWVGLSKETAHQLGTPLSSLLAWVEYFKAKEGEPVKMDDILEIEKDVARLEIITQRFSKIGSSTELKEENIVNIVEKIALYMKKRSSQKITYSVQAVGAIYAKVNAPLLDWVIENLCKNAVNAIGDNVGAIEISIVDSDGQYIYIDVKDTGKGISKVLFKTVFQPGYTTRDRGWGLGLTLSKRIIEQYHHGKLFVLSSVVGKGSTFRISLPRG